MRKRWGAKAVTALLRNFGWKSIIDWDEITSARATEQMMPISLRLWGKLRTPDFNLGLSRL